MSESQTPPSRAALIIEDLKRAPRDKRIVGGLIAAVAAGVLFGLVMKPTLGDRPAAERAGVGRTTATAKVTDTEGLDIVVDTRRPAEGRVPEATTLLEAPIQGIPPLVEAPGRQPLFRINARAQPVAEPGSPLMPMASAGRQIPRAEVRRCADARSYAEEMVCAEPRLAAADRRLRQAYDRALDAGVRPQRLERQQRRWLAAREQAAQDHPSAVEEVYDVRIAELEDMSAYPD